MSIRVKVQPTAVGLCATCRESMVTEYANGTSTTLCYYYGGNPPIRIVAPVVRCNQYDKKGALNNFEMEKIAWTVRTDSSGKSIGFAPPKKDKDD